MTGCAYFLPAQQVGKQVLVRGTLCQATGDSDEPEQHHLLATCWDDRDLPQETPIFTVNGATNTPAETTSQFLNEGTRKNNCPALFVALSLCSILQLLGLLK